MPSTATFRSKYANYTVWIGKEIVRFTDGLYITDDSTIIEELKKLPDFGQALFVEAEYKVEFVEPPVPEPETETKPEVTPETVVKPEVEVSKSTGEKRKKKK